MFDHSQLEKLLAMSDDELRRKISDAAISAGADKYMTARVLSDMPKLRAMMSGLTAEQINSAVSKFGTGSAEELAKKINGGK